VTDSAKTLVKPRVLAIDAARAVAIIGVVFNHAIDGLVSSGLLATDTRLAHFNAALYIFRMPALVFIVGFFIIGGTSRYGLAKYIKRRARLLAYLYVLWFFIQTIAELATGSVKNNPRTADSLIRIWEPPAHLWFLPFLALSTAIVAWVVASRGAAWLVGGLTVASVFLWGWNPSVVGVQGISLIGFLAAGAYLGLPRATKLLTQPAGVAAVVLLMSAAAFTAMYELLELHPSTLGENIDAPGGLVSYAAASAGICAMLAAASLMARWRLLAALLAFIGSRTLEIYLAHVIVVAGSRVLLTKGLGLEQPVPLAIITVVLGIMVPIVAATFANRLGLSWIFALPKKLR